MNFRGISGEEFGFDPKVNFFVVDILRFVFDQNQLCKRTVNSNILQKLLHYIFLKRGGGGGSEGPSEILKILKRSSDLLREAVLKQATIEIHKIISTL